TYPSFDLNHPYTLDEESAQKLSLLDPESAEYAETKMNLLYAMWKNKAVSTLYEPGYNMKMVTTANIWLI
ncbi:MAG: hypothetical protein J6R61_06030, partial [Bacteroidales bacterium]|nr:hypothetical protein [Bacteroidales bacterium]